MTGTIGAFAFSAGAFGCSEGESESRESGGGGDSASGRVGSGGSDTSQEPGSSAGANDEPSFLVHQSEVYPFGLEYQLFADSPSVNLPPHGSHLQQPIGNTGADNELEAPELPTPVYYSTVLYFDSQAEPGGDGSKEAPFDDIALIEEQAYESDTALLLARGSVFYKSALRAGGDKERIFFGNYGEGNLPIVANVDDFESPQEFILGSEFGGTDITVVGIHFVGGGTGTYDRLMNIGGTRLTIAHSHLESIDTPGTGYLFNIFKGGAQEMTLYHCELGYSRDDIWYASSSGSYRILSNYFHHANLSVFNTDNFDPEDRETWRQGGGDIIQFEYEGLDGALIADNFFDKGDSSCKFALIFNGGETNQNVEVRDNTVIGPMDTCGGAAIQWHTVGVLRDNLILNTDPEGTVSALASFEVFASEITGNHFVGYPEGAETYNLGWSDLGPGNERYATLEAYQAAVPPDERRGSSIFAER